MMTEVIHTDNLTKRFGTFTAVDHISFDVHHGEVFGFLGANGAGKTTAIRIITGLLKADEGTVMIGGKDAFLYSGQVIGSGEKQTVLEFLRALPLKDFTVLVCDFANWAETAPLPCIILKK